MFGWLLKRQYKGRIKIDIDTKKYINADFINVMNEKFKELNILMGAVNYSKNGGIHIYGIPKKPITETEAILIQALLGSDIKREHLNYRRLMHDARLIEWNILFDEKFD